MKPKLLNILFVSEYFYPRLTGGEVWSWELCTALATKGHKVTVITCKHDDSPETETIQKVKILRKAKTTANVEERDVRLNAIAELLEYIENYIKDRQDEIDIIHVMAYGLNVQVSRLAKKHRIPCITSVHSYFGRHWDKVFPLNLVLRWAEKRKLNIDESSIIHVPSKYLKHRINKYVSKKSRIVVIPNWLPEYFPKSRKLDKNTILFVGSLESIKRPLDCIAVMKKFPEAKLIVIGKGNLMKKVRKSAEEAHIKAEFMKNLSHEETLSYIGGASLLLVPSITESFSLVALEAIAQGTPVSGRKTGILPELPGVISFPPKKIPRRLSGITQARIRKQYAKKRIITEFEQLYRGMR
jgi:glycosyltransferase involved in cell wall biosynthesis